MLCMRIITHTVTHGWRVGGVLDCLCAFRAAGSVGTPEEQPVSVCRVLRKEEGRGAKDELACFRAMAAGAKPAPS